MLTAHCIKCGAPERKRRRRICADCYNMQNRVIMRRVNKTEKAKARAAVVNAKNQMNPTYRISTLFRSAKSGAKRRGIKFELTPEWLAAQNPHACAATGIPFSFGPTPENAVRHPWAPSLDRIDSKKGYAPENVQIVCWAYNVAKHEFSADVLLRLARAIVDAHG